MEGHPRSGGNVLPCTEQKSWWRAGGEGAEETGSAPPAAGFLNLTTAAVRGWDNSLLWDWRGACKTFSSIPGLLTRCQVVPSLLTTKLSPNFVKCPLGDKTAPT